MSLYQISTTGEPDEETRTLDRLGGAPVGLKTADWPRCRGVPMQLLATVELDGRCEGRDGVVMVFVDSFHETDAGDADAVAVRIVDRASVETNGPTAPPRGYVAEQWPENSDRVLCLDPADDDEIGEDDSYLGGDANWPEQTGQPDRVPGGAFLMRLMSDVAPLGRGQNALLVFEEGAVITPQSEPGEDDPLPWAEAIAKSREILVGDGAPEAGSLFKFGGAPRAGSEWPTDSRDRPLTHLMTLPADIARSPSDDDVAIAYYIDLRRIRRSDWDAQPDFIETETITREMLDEELEIPARVELLPERRLELRPFANGVTWRELVGKSMVGPRGAYLNPEEDCATAGFELQLATSILPNSGDQGALYFFEGLYPYFQRPGAPRRDDDGDGDFFDDSHDEDGAADEIDQRPVAGTSIRRAGVGQTSTSYAGGLPPAIGVENWPRFEGEPMTHVMTLDLRQIPDLAGRAAALSVFVSTAKHHQASAPHNNHAAVLTLEAEQLEGRCEPPPGEAVEILPMHPLLLEHQEALDEAMVFAGGAPRWLQGREHSGLFIAQVDENVVDINLGDGGVLYIFADTAFFQCH